MDELLSKYFEGKLNTYEKIELFNEIEKNPELLREFIEYKNIHSLFVFSLSKESEKEVKLAYQRFREICLKRRRKDLTIKVLTYAATFALLIISTYFITYNYLSLNKHAELSNTLYVPAGQRLKLTLADGTDVWLNAQTKLTYPAIFEGTERRVVLDGEAYFDVTKNSKMPFIVSTQDLELKVLGTEFNVYSYSSEDYSQTSLISGSLQIYQKDKQAEAIVLNPNDQIIIKKNNRINTQFKLPKDTTPNTKQTKMISTENISKITNIEHFLWKDGIYSFNNEPLIVILRKLEIYYDVKFIIEDASIYQWEYTGKFRQQDGLDKILEMIGRIHSFKTIKNENTNTVTLSHKYKS